MKELLNFLSKITNFLHENRNVNFAGEGPDVHVEKTGDDQYEAKDVLIKGKIDLSGKDAQEEMFAAAKDEAASMVASLKLDGKKTAEGVAKVQELDKEHPTLKYLERTLSLAGVNKERTDEVVSDALLRAGRMYKENPAQVYAYMTDLNSVLTKWREENKTLAARRQNMQDLVSSVDRVNGKHFA